MHYLRGRHTTPPSPLGKGPRPSSTLTHPPVFTQSCRVTLAIFPGVLVEDARAPSGDAGRGWFVVGMMTLFNLGDLAGKGGPTLVPALRWSRQGGILGAVCLRALFIPAFHLAGERRWPGDRLVSQRSSERGSSRGDSAPLGAVGMEGGAHRAEGQGMLIPASCALPPREPADAS